MSNLLPLATFNLALDPFSPQPCQAEEFPITVRITLAAIDPEAVDDKEEPSTLRLLKKSELSSEDDDYLMGSSGDEDSEEDSEEESEEEKPASKKTAAKKAAAKEDSDAEDSDEEDADDAVEEHVICTLSPKFQYQQSLDITITPEEEVYFVVTGSYRVHLTGNYVDHPNDEDEDDYIYGDDSEGDSEDYDLTPDEDEIISDDAMEYDLEELDDVEDVEGKIEELLEEASQKKRKSTDVAEKESKKSKKEKTVKFNKELEQGPTPTKKEAAPAKKEVAPTKKEAALAKKEAASTKKEVAPVAKEAPKPKAKTIAGGVVIEDKSSGSGPLAKKGQKVGVRYIGKLKNGKVFDKNTSGKPFVFALGKGEVIKGWDVGVAGMAVGGERRIVIPAPMAYGKSKIPGIPPNSELTFDVKLLSIK